MTGALLVAAAALLVSTASLALSLWSLYISRLADFNAMMAGEDVEHLRTFAFPRSNPDV